MPLTSLRFQKIASSVSDLLIIEGKQEMLASDAERCSKDRLAIILCAATVPLSFQLEGSIAIHVSFCYGNRVSDVRSHKPGSMDLAASTNPPCLSDASSALPLAFRLLRACG